MKLLEFNESDIDNIVEGFDTETYKGNVLLLTSSNDYIDNKGNSLKPYDIFNFLYAHGKQFNFFYNIKYDLSVMIKSLLLSIKDINMKKQTKEDIKNGKNIPIYHNGLLLYKLSFIDNKSFSLLDAKNNREKRYFDIANFYKSGYYISLDNISKIILNKNKLNEELNINREKIGSEEGYYLKNRDLIIKYGIEDANLTKKLTINYLKMLSHIFGNKYIPDTFNSGASISKAYLFYKHKKQKYSFYKLFDNIDNKEIKKILKIIGNTYKGGIFYQFYLGKFDNAYEIDLNSAYPKALTELYDINDCAIERVKEFKKIEDKDYGFYRVKILLNTQKYPVATRMKNGIMIYPISDIPFELYLTQIEIEFLLNENYNIEIIEGIIFHTKGKKLFEDYLNLYKERLIYKNKQKEISKIPNYKDNKELQKEYAINLIKDNQYKTILNASYGAFAEHLKGYTEWSNFIYASYITSKTRIRIYRALKLLRENNLEPLAVMTDAIVFKGNYNNIRDKIDSSELGKFKLEDYNGFIFFMSGIYITNKNGIEYLKGKRGFRGLNLNIIKNTNDSIIKVVEKKPLGLKEGIIQQRINEIGDFITIEKILDLHSLLFRYEINEEYLNFQYLLNNPVKLNPIYYNGKNEDRDLNILSFYNKLYIYRKYKK